MGMSPVRYRFLLTPPPEAYEGDFLVAEEDEIKVKLIEEDGDLVLLIYSPRVERSERLLEGIQEEVGLELCG